MRCVLQVIQVNFYKASSNMTGEEPESIKRCASRFISIVQWQPCRFVAERNLDHAIAAVSSGVINQFPFKDRLGHQQWTFPCFDADPLSTRFAALSFRWS